MFTCKEICQIFPSVPAWRINYFLHHKAPHLKGVWSLPWSDYPALAAVEAVEFSGVRTWISHGADQRC